MEKEMFDIEKFNVISDEENYYFFRSLEPGDVEDLEKGIIKDGENYQKLRTDRERWEETHQEAPRWNAESTVSLEEMYNHIKIHYSLQTNCISLSSNANVARTYGEAFSDKYVMIKVPKKEMGEKVFHAGQYMLDEIEKKVEQRITEGGISENILKDLQEVENAKTSDEIKELIKRKYKTPKKLDETKARPNKGISYKSPHARVSSWQSLDEKQTLEKNKIIAKLTILEHKKLMEPLMPHSANNNLLVRTVGNAFASSEQIYYGDIEGNRITDISKEALDMFGLLQQVEGQDKQIVDELKGELIRFVNGGNKIEIPANSILRSEAQAKDDISIEEMYELTNGKVEYGEASSIVKNLFYLAKGQASARALAKELRKITNNNSKYEEVIKYIEDNGFEIEPKIITRQSNKGYKLSESVNLNLKPDEKELVEQIKLLLDEEQDEIIKSGGLSNVQGLITDNFFKLQKEEQISKERYYAEAIFSMYDWKKIGIDEFSVAERENLIQRIQAKNCVEIYKQLEEQGIAKNDIPKILLNTITGRKENLEEELSIEQVERFLGYYDVPNTGIQLRPYQQKATDNTDEILENNRFASVILPTGGGKSFVALDQLMKHQNEKILYLAPQNEILEQMKDYIIKYIHGPVNTLGKSKDELVAEVFPNLKFATYPSLLSKEGEKLLKEQYDFIVLDELHRTGATEWGDRLNTLLDNQPETTKVLGITATPRRDADGKNMANEIAERLGYTNKDAVRGKHVAINMSLTNAIRMGLVVNPKLVSCAYTLKTDGSLDRLKNKIDQIEDIKVRNEKLEKYEKLRRNIDKAEGIPEILQSNVKKGGKYIVFLPMVDELEDEDGNKIGRKKGKAKITDYEKQIAEYFKGSDITPNFHSMLGEYGDKSNAKRLEEFQSRDTDDTEFMLVMNKANEGLHLDKLDGMIWLRPMDENSRILYLQQLGRVIYSEDPDNPTKDEDRPVVIDLVNNTLKVNWKNEITEQDDIEMLNIIIDWTVKHDGILPDINSNDKEENGYARVLKEIQNKYKEYLNNNFEDLTDEQIDEVQEVLRLGAEIDLWQSELPDRIARKGENNRNSSHNSYEGPFELVGVEKDFVELEEEVDNTNNTVDKFIRKLEVLTELGVDISKMTKRDTIETLAKKSGVKITEDQANKLGIELNDKIGSSKSTIVATYRGQCRCIPPTKEQVRRLLELGISFDKIERDVVQEFIEKVEKLTEMGVNVSKIQSKDTIKTLSEKSRVRITENQANKLGIELNDKIGSSKDDIAKRYRGTGRGKMPTREQVKRLLKLGISLDKIERNVVQEFIKKVEKLTEVGVDVSKMQSKDTIKTLSEKSRIRITENQANKLGIELNDKIGSSKVDIAKAYRGKGRQTAPTQEQVKRLLELGISLEKRNTVQEFIEKVEKLKKMGVDVSKLQKKDTIKTLAEKSNVEITEEQANKLEIRLDEKIGNIKNNIASVYRGTGKGEKPTREQVKRLLKLGISLEKRNTVQEFIEKVEKLTELGVDISQMTRIDTIETLAKKSDVKITEDQADKLEIGLADKIGYIKENIAMTYRGKEKREKPTQEQVKRLLELGISLEKIERNAVQEFIEKLEKLTVLGVDISKMTQRDTIETLSEKSKIKITEEQADKLGIELYDKIGRTKERVIQKYRGTEKGKKLTQEQVKRLLELGISLASRKLNSKEIAEATISSIKNIELTDREEKALQELVEKNKTQKKEEQK